MKLIKWIAALTVLLALGTATTAGAAPVTVGSTLSGVPVEAGLVEGSGTFINLAFGEPTAHATSPVTGAIVNWNLLDATGSFRLRVLRPAGGTAYTAVASSSTATASGGLQTFSAATPIPIQAGDAIGLDINPGDKIALFFGDPADLAAAWMPVIPDGATQPYTVSEDELEFAFNAIVQPAPTLTAVSPSSGSIGTVVTVTGTDFANVSGVSFGGVPATSFTVASEGQLTAVAPAVKKAGAVDVTVTTAAGTTPITATDKFIYKPCVVPKLKGKKLEAAKKKLKKASCKLGKVTRHKGVTNKTGKVVKQSPKTGKQLAPGSKVKVTLG